MLSRGLAGTLLCVGGAILASSAVSSTGCNTDAGTAPPPLCPDGQTTCEVHLTLLHTSDIHSRLFDYSLLIAQTDANLGLGEQGVTKTVGGVARMAYVINRERARSNRVLHLDSGDVWQGAPIFNYYKGEPEVRAMSQLFPDAMVIGNHEYDDGALNVATQFQKWKDFPLLGANYEFYKIGNPAATRMSTLLQPFEVFTQQGLRIAVIGMGNLSTLGSLFNQPNGLGMIPLSSTEVAQTYVDLLRPYVDVVIVLSHLGLDADQEMVRSTTGIDMVLGGHNHIVINPPQQLSDCTADSNHPGYIWAVDPNIPYDLSQPPPAVDNTDPKHPIALPDPTNHPYEFQRPCAPRNVIIEHSGAFAKYVGRDDLILSNDAREIAANKTGGAYDPVDGFEIISNQYTVFPIDTRTPEDPVMVQLLEPYKLDLAQTADLDILVGFAPSEVSRTAPQGGDAALGNLVATAMWLRLGVQTDFSLTNTTGIRTDMNPGPITLEEMFNIFPFNNAITKMQLSGLEVEELFDYVARRSSGRGCVSQAQIAGARVRLNCSGCTRPDAIGPCTTDDDCVGGAPQSCDNGQCHVPACAESIYIGHRSCTVDADCGVGVAKGTCEPNNFGGTCKCQQDSDCGTPLSIGICDVPATGGVGACGAPIALENSYALATSDYLAGGGSGYQVLKRNTTQQNTMIQQRDALTDYLHEGKPCGYSATSTGPNGLDACSTDKDCNTAPRTGYVCACPAHSHETSPPCKTTTDGCTTSIACTTDTAGCSHNSGQCVLDTCRNQVAAFHDAVCDQSPNLAGCLKDLNPCSLAGEECKFLSCVDGSIGGLTDNRVEMIGR